MATKTTNKTTTKTTSKVKASYSVKAQNVTVDLNRILKNAIRRGRPFTTDDFNIPSGYDRRYLGGFMTRAYSKGLITPIGFVPSTRPEARNRVIRQWVPKGAVVVKSTNKTKAAR